MQKKKKSKSKEDDQSFATCVAHCALCRREPTALFKVWTQRFKHTSGLSISVRFSKDFIAHRKIMIDLAKTLFYLTPGNIFVLFLQSPHQEFTRAVNITAPCYLSKTVQRDLEKRSAISAERQ